MKASLLFQGIDGRLLKGDLNFEVAHVTDNSKNCRPNCVFFAIKGEKADGHDFVKEAVFNGASLVVVEKEVDVEATVFLVDNTKKVACEVLRRFYWDADNKLFKIGITGTNGKTTVAYLLWQFLNKVGKNASLLGTVEYVIVDKREKPVNTTPGLFDLWKFIARTVESGGTHLVMEVSSHALKQGRIGDIAYEVAVFTNLSHDHLDYHGNMEDYFNSKRMLFTHHLNGVAVINKDDPYGGRLIKELKGVLDYGIETEASVKGAVWRRMLPVVCGL